ncbi:uncharacterized protein DUF3509 [Pseudomonas duriflava]|uniref:Uncharacterized protein DUF3509 n=1 Tax=Pseudomonas duriflava TaxID=459528 RepID=A0A562QE88_9PSED|nr:DUF3509 domain-containing protein [Pseudomonas duriflava]TWI55019.1 uncharacterized protein DUF3509 [Pseudomonas duriflava]
MEQYLKTLDSSFVSNHPVVSALRPDGSLTLTFATDDKDVVAIRVISAADLKDSERLQTHIAEIEKQLLIMAGKLDRHTITRSNMVYLSNFRNEWTQSPLAPRKQKLPLQVPPEESGPI